MSDHDHPGPGDHLVSADDHPGPGDHAEHAAEPVGPEPDGADPIGAEPMGAGLERALAAAYRYLNRRERTQAEMRAQLSRAGTDPVDVEQAVATLVEQGYLDDRRFVRLFVQDKRELEEWGSDRIRRALLAKGVDRDVVSDALDEQNSGGEIERAIALLRRRFPAPAHDRRQRERALGMLLRKGYDSQLALDAIAAQTHYPDDM